VTSKKEINAQRMKALVRLLTRITNSIRRRYRGIYYRFLLSSVGKGCNFGGGIVIQGPQYIQLGERVRINDLVVLQCGPGSTLVIHDDANVSFGAVIMTGEFPVGASGHDRTRHIYESVDIGSGAWIGAGAIVLPGIRIGEGAIVSAGAVVTNDVPPNTIVAGIPARVVRKFNT
jgi:acetyltransferase-like isoleucine patch superfamily enzyme